MERERRGTTEEIREGTGPPAEPVAPTAETAPVKPDAPAERPPPGAGAHPQHHKIRRTRLSGTWTAVIGFGIVLLLLLIFILQNQNTVDVSYFGAHGQLPLGVALLLAAVLGILLVALAGSARMMQLRATARKHRRADKKAAQPQS